MSATPRMCLVLVCTLAANGVSAQELIPKEYCETLVADALSFFSRSEARARGTSRARQDLKRVESAQPSFGSFWKERTITMGEFEPEEEFRERLKAFRAEQASLKVVAKQRFREATGEWEKELAEARQRVDEADQLAVRSQADVPSLFAYEDLKRIVASQELTWRVPGDVALPHFDRNNMCFRNISFDQAPLEIAYRGDQSVLGAFRIAGMEKIRIECQDLAVAKNFKEDYEAGRVSLTLEVEPRLRHHEMPIIVEPSKYVETLDEGAIGRTAAEVILKLAFAAAGNENVPGVKLEKEYTKMVEVPAKTRPGVRFHFASEVLGVVAVDSAGAPLPGIRIVPEDRMQVVEVVRVKEDAFDAWRAVVPRPGDVIVSVGSQRIRDSDELKHVLGRLSADGEAKITCFRPESEERFDIVATKDEFRSLEWRTAWRSRRKYEKCTGNARATSTASGRDGPRQPSPRPANKPFDPMEPFQVTPQSRPVPE